MPPARLATGMASRSVWPQASIAAIVAITVSPALHAAMMEELEGDRFDPMATARALARVVAARRKLGAEPLTFGMTFPFSTHNYQLRFWMAAGGVDPDHDIHLVVLPPPFMVDSLASGQIDAFCVGAPWNAIAVDRGVGHILHFVSDILVRAAEKVLAFRRAWSDKNPDVVAALIRALQRAAEFISNPQNRAEAARLLAKPERIGVKPDIILRAIEGRLQISPAGETRSSDRFLLLGGEGTSRPEPVQAAWLYAQMVRWGQAPMTPGALDTAMAVFRPDLYDAALGQPGDSASAPHLIGAFAGPPFDPTDIVGHLAAWNYFQSAVFSGIVSGSATDPGLLKATIEGPELLTGGSFGMERSVIALVLCTTTGVILLMIAIRRGHIMPPMWKR